MAAMELLEYIQDIAPPHDQGLPECGKIFSQFAQVVGDETPLSGGCVGAGPITRLGAIERQYRAMDGRRREGGMIRDAKVSFVPDYL